MPARPYRGPAVGRLRDPQGQEDIISTPKMHWRAFFILFHHFYPEKTYLKYMHFQIYIM